ncbi:MAG: magnesium/cobalt efflux protein [Alteromonadaceae bacterium]|uniref:HlyC/CorC family transporter n=1 Tax=unclassified Marinobacter TaxID=83889 RepID=UPI000C3FC211|nr:transporter associated domain-containing protein [Marinobacter sp. BGYM27]MAA66083.1 magnesium/cobalt efflux protein [Alteromonadaceae bacterium]MBH86339.1 magnesium/cobalt efflux protein [Alteromonadaceae bacterium]MDG5499286.1 transporter associated domain-containing protein [Marinobacter sp. BGYM27]|tara:strand:+ start:703 stop:1548 length:846 start_codon:yes stop_codon:yes gene_type:complete
MSDDHSSRSQGNKSWLERISQAFSNEPESITDILEILRDAEDHNIIDADAMSIIEGAMQVTDMRADEIMIPRSQMVTVKASTDPKSFLTEIMDSAHSRFPVIGDSQDDVIGVLLAKDLLPLALNNDLSWSKIREVLRPPTFVPESKRLNQLLKEFKETRNHMAIVVDEYGGTAGLITIEDVLEQIVGEIEDEHDFDEETHIKARADGNYAVKAVTSVEDFNEFFDCKLDEEDFDTIGGLVLKEFGHLPRRGEETSFGGFQFTILNADNRVIRLIQVRRHES